MKPKIEQPNSNGNTLNMRTPTLAEQQKNAAKLDSLLAYVNEL
jgi:hypothetical protein